MGIYYNNGNKSEVIDIHVIKSEHSNITEGDLEVIKGLLIRDNISPLLYCDYIKIDTDNGDGDIGRKIKIESKTFTL
ncbi:hypothetical protein [Paraclostridium bifermentans]|uniref:hypothetical protein n=1 Tax=Paraclostridium bifermentans TaxID=1490 RepID=UPI0018A95D6D|nr:hypothetical protein [Paraclostridium bifermentans]